MKPNNLVAAIGFILLFFVFDNCRAQNSVASDLPSIRKAIEKNNAVYFRLFAKNDSAILNLYADDACLLVPNELPICGREALKKDFEDTFAAGRVKGVKFKTTDIYGDGKEYVTEEGTWQVFGAGGKLIDDGKYLKLWKRTKTGWKIFRDLFNSDHKTQ